MNLKLLFATVVASTALFAAPLAFAHEDTQGNADLSLGLHLGQLMRGDVHGHGKLDSDGDDDNVRATSTASTTAGMHVRAHVLGGVVTSIAGNVFTIDPFGPASTTTVTTDGTTKWKSKGGATSTGALSVGSRVLVFGNLVSGSTTGSTTASSTPSADTFAAVIVKILGHGFGHFRSWLGLGANIR